jgi:hypothetical protein
MELAERGFELVRDFQLKGKGFLISWWIFRGMWLKNGCWMVCEYLRFFSVPSGSYSSCFPKWVERICGLFGFLGRFP